MSHNRIVRVHTSFRNKLLQDSDSSLATIGPHWPSSYPEYLSPNQGKDEQRRIVWARLLSQRTKLAKSLREQKERYQALRRELNPRTTQAESSHDPLYRDRYQFHILPTIKSVPDKKTSKEKKNIPRMKVIIHPPHGPSAIGTRQVRCKNGPLKCLLCQSGMR